MSSFLLMNAGRGHPDLVTLDEVGHLRPALPLARKRLEAGDRPCLALCPAAIAGDGDVSWAHTYPVAPDRASLDRYILAANDIVFFMRLPFRLAFLDIDTFERRRAFSRAGTLDVEPVVAVGQMATLRVTLPGVDPGYIAWFLRHPETQDRLRELVQGITLQFLPMKAVRQLLIPLPSLAVQRAIANAWVFQRRISRLAAERESLSAQLTDATCMESIHELFPHFGLQRRPRS